MEAEESTVDFERAIAMTGGYGPYQRRLLIVMAPIGLTFVFGVSSMGFVLPAIVCDFSVSKYEIGLLYSAIYIGMVPFGVLWGSAADMLGRKLTLLITSALASVFEFMTAFSHCYWFLFACKVLAGCSTAGAHLTYYVYLSEFVDATDKDTMTMRAGGIAGFGYLFMPLIASILIPRKFKWEIIEDKFYVHSWNVFLLFCSLAPILGTIVTACVLGETPKYLLVRGKSDQSLDILRQVYARNTGNLPESFPVKTLTVSKNEDTESTDSRSNVFSKSINLAKPLFKSPYLIPALMAFAAQIITMGSYNAIRQYLPTLVTLSLGIGQTTQMNVTVAENKPFCALFETQNIFKNDIKCDQDDIKLRATIYYASAVVGLSVLISFYLGKTAVKKFGKIKVFLTAHLAGAAAIFCFPFSTAIFSVIILGIYSCCMQNCLTIAIGLVIGRVPTTVRGLAVSLVMVCGRTAVIVGNQILPALTNYSCKITFWFLSGINLMAIPIMYCFSKQPNPLERAALESADEGINKPESKNKQG